MVTGQYFKGFCGAYGTANSPRGKRKTASSHLLHATEVAPGQQQKRRKNAPFIVYHNLLNLHFVGH
ncbi:hypothetical protein EB241_08075 [Erwinia psidii]|uniref:Uncharacterized protein n=1 Tax=Erwinia psidii TaxID=69224 RepID=A0A3N6S1E8_9GAMM|nr:hypothetical protein EB241_08075 [Erwinia psidii]